MTRNLDHIDAWIFDLDNTLYPARINLFAQIDVRIKGFISQLLKLQPEEAFILQKKYYREHGTSMRGLMIQHDGDPDAFLDYVHDIDHSVLKPDTALNAALAALPGRKFVFTNGSARHAERTLEQLGVVDHFSGIHDIRAGNYVPKPDPTTYAALVAKHRIKPVCAAMFEDLHINLKPAAALGMTTVFISTGDGRVLPGDDLSHCHYVTDSLIDWLNGKR